MVNSIYADSVLKCLVHDVKTVKYCRQVDTKDVDIEIRGVPRAILITTKK